MALEMAKQIQAATNPIAATANPVATILAVVPVVGHPLLLGVHVQLHGVVHRAAADPLQPAKGLQLSRVKMNPLTPRTPNSNSTGPGCPFPGIVPQVTVDGHYLGPFVASFIQGSGVGGCVGGWVLGQP